jgi:hypothetical protein
MIEDSTSTKTPADALCGELELTAAASHSIELIRKPQSDSGSPLSLRMLWVPTWHGTHSSWREIK